MHSFGDAFLKILIFLSRESHCVDRARTRYLNQVGFELQSANISGVCSPMSGSFWKSLKITTVAPGP